MQCIISKTNIVVSFVCSVIHDELKQLGERLRQGGDLLLALVPPAHARTTDDSYTRRLLSKLTSYYGGLACTLRPAPCCRLAGACGLGG